jgi:hypothetical protein
MKIAICIPCHGDTKAEFTGSLARMIAHSLRQDRELEIETLVARSSILVQSRTRLFDWSREWGADRILWLDSDHTFPPEALLQLLKHDVPVVGANYRRRDPRVFPTAVKKDADGRWQILATTREKAALGRLEEADRIGFGMLLMDPRTVAAAFGEPLYPLFETTSLPNGEFVGEDSLFCDRLIASGLKIWIDHRVSHTIGHIGEHTFKFP